MNQPITPRKKIKASALYWRASLVALIYMALAGLWIWLSDGFLARLITDPVQLSLWQTYKGWLFVLISGGVLWIERYWSDRRVADVEDRLFEQMTERTSELERLRQQLDILLDNAPVAFAMRGVDNRYILTNRRWAEFAGIGHKEALGKTPYELFSPEVANELTAALDRVWDKPEGLMDEVALHMNGRDFFFMRASFPLFDDSGKPYAALGLVTDISDRKQVEESLRLAEERFRVIFETVGVAINLMDTNGYYVSTNPAFQKMLGYSEEELRGKHFSDVSYPPDVLPDQELKDKFEQSPDRIVRFDKRYVRADGSLVWARVVLSDIYGQEGEVVSQVVVVEDISSLKEMEAERQRTQEELERLVAQRTVELQRANNELAEAQRIAHLGNWNVDLATGRLVWSAETYRIFGYDPDAFQSSQQIFEASVHEEDREFVLQVRDQTLLGKPMDYEHRVVRPNGEVRVVHEHGYLVRDENGEPVGIFGTVQDITERKQAEAEILSANARLSTMLQASPLGIIVLDKHHVVQEWNPACERIYGYSAEKIVGRVMPAFFQQDDAVQQLARERVLAGVAVSGFETKRIRSDGSTIDVRISTAPMLDAHGKLNGVVAMVEDITEHKRVNEALRASEERFSRIFYSSPYPTGYGNLFDGVLLDVNDRFAEFFGVAREEMIGNKVTNFGDWLRAEDRERFVAQLTMDGMVLDEEVNLIRADGQERDVLISMYRLSLGTDEMTIGMFTDITQRTQAEAEVRRLNQELEARVAERTAHLQLEIAERVRAEAEVKELNLVLAEQAEHLVAVNKELETFTYSVSHDLKAPLRGIDGYSRLLLEDYADRLDDEGQYFLNTIRNASTQMAQLIDDLLSYSRLERKTFAVSQVDLQSLIRSILFQMQPTHLYPQTLIDVRIEPVVIHTDMDALAMILRNLIDNALKFSANVPAPLVEVVGENVADSYRLCVRDNGVGFDMQYQERIFEIFQRLHRAEDYPGTGIGLAMVRKALQRMQGKIEVDSQPGQGTTFTMEIQIQ